MGEITPNNTQYLSQVTLIPFEYPAVDDNEITEKLVTDFISKHKENLPYYSTRKDIYEGRHNIYNRENKPPGKPDNRIMANFSKYIVDIEDGFFCGIPIKVSHPNEDVNEKLNRFVRINNEDDINSEVSKLCGIYGHGYKIVYQDKDGTTRVAFEEPQKAFVVYDNTIGKQPLFGVWYGEDQDKNLAGYLFTRASKIPLTGSKSKISFGEHEENVYGEIPIIEFMENEERHCAFHHVAGLVDAYNLTLSEKMNDVEYFADAYLAILGAKLDEEGILRIKDNRIINLYGTDKASDIIVKFLDKPNADQTQENLIDRLEKLIYQISMVADVNRESFGNASGVALEYLLYEMKTAAATKENKFKAALRRQYKMLCSVPTVFDNAKGDLWEDIDFQFTRNVPRNIKEEAETLGALYGKTSDETAYSALSIIPNGQEEVLKKVMETIDKARETTKGLNSASLTGGADGD